MTRFSGATARVRRAIAQLARRTLRMRKSAAYWAAILCVMAVSAAIAIDVESIVRTTFSTALDTAADISTARRDLDITRSALSSQTRALLQFGRTGRISRLEEFRANAFDALTLRVETEMRSIGAGNAVYPLALARATHQAWMQRVESQIARDPRAFAPPHGVPASRAGGRIRSHIDDIEKTNMAIDANLDQIRASLDASERALKDRINRTVPRVISLTAFAGAMLILASVTALIFARRYFLERRRTTRLARAFSGARLPAPNGVSLDGVLVPLPGNDIVGGDWYDVRELPDGTLFLTIGDVAGHGVEAAVLAANIRRGLLGAAIGTADPAVVLHRINHEFRGETLASAGVVCAYYAPATRLFSYASAGMPAPLVCERDSVHYLPYGGPPLGVDADYRYDRHNYTLQPHAQLYLYTDGAIEHTRNSIDGEARLQTCVRAISGRHLAQQLFSMLFASAKQRDDVAVLALSLDRPPHIDAVTSDAAAAPARRVP